MATSERGPSKSPHIFPAGASRRRPNDVYIDADVDAAESLNSHTAEADDNATEPSQPGTNRRGVPNADANAADSSQDGTSIDDDALASSRPPNIHLRERDDDGELQRVRFRFSNAVQLLTYCVGPSQFSPNPA
jgi:hypothetical protein